MFFGLPQSRYFEDPDAVKAAKCLVAATAVNPTDFSRGRAGNGPHTMRLADWCTGKDNVRWPRK